MVYLEQLSEDLESLAANLDTWKGRKMPGEKWEDFLELIMTGATSGLGQTDDLIWTFDPIIMRLGICWDWG